MTLKSTNFKGVCECREAYTFVSEHPHPEPAHSAVVNTSEIMVSTIRDLYNGAAASVFKEKNFQWINAEVVAILFSTIMSIINNPDPIKSLESIAREMAVMLKGESSKNEVVEQIIKQRTSLYLTNPLRSKRDEVLAPTVSQGTTCAYSTK